VNSHLFIEKIGSETTLREGATAEDLAFVERISNSGRRCEVLAWRAIVRRELGADVEIFYDEYGAPKVDRPNTYIGVSHSKGVVAVYISEKPCAVDIEHSNRDFRRVADRYLSDAERSIAEQYDIFAEMFGNQINHFYDCCMNGAKCKAPAEDGVVLMQILDSIYESARTGHEVEIK
jgi:predicted dehydrogenase